MATTIGGKDVATTGSGRAVGVRLLAVASLCYVLIALSIVSSAAIPPRPVP